MTHIVELGDRVLEATVTPDTPGRCRRRCVLAQLSGPPLTAEEWDRATAAVVAEMVGRGMDVIGWGEDPSGGES